MYYNRLGVANPFGFDVLRSYHYFHLLVIFRLKCLYRLNLSNNYKKKLRDECRYNYTYA